MLGNTTQFSSYKTNGITSPVNMSVENNIVGKCLKMNLHQVQSVWRWFSFCSNFSKTNNSETGSSIYLGREQRKNSPRPQTGKPLKKLASAGLSSVLYTNKMPTQRSGIKTNNRPNASHSSPEHGSEKDSALFSIYNKPSHLCDLSFGRVLGE